MKKIITFILKSLSPDVLPHFFYFDSAPLSSFVSIKRFFIYPQSEAKKSLKFCEQAQGWLNHTLWIISLLWTCLSPESGLILLHRSYRSGSAHFTSPDIEQQSRTEWAANSLWLLVAQKGKRIYFVSSGSFESSTEAVRSVLRICDFHWFKVWWSYSDTEAGAAYHTVWKLL